MSKKYNSETDEAKQTPTGWEFRTRRSTEPWQIMDARGQQRLNELFRVLDEKDHL
jgi:hypothetical protein